MRNFFLLFIIFLFSCSDKKEKASDDNSSAVRFDGIYATGKLENESTGDTYRYFLRFYEDGKVITVTSSGTPEQLSKWFKKGHENVNEGEYKTEGDQINFSTANNSGEVSYKGTIVNSNKLKLHVSNASNNHEEDVTYSFTELED